MQRSHYLKIWPCDEKPGSMILYSARKASVVRVTENVLQKIESGSLSPEDEALFASLEMLVPDREAEKRTALMELDTLNKQSAELRITVVLNLDCNFACPYCYEGNLKGNLYMSDETAGRVIRFIKQRFTPDKTSLRVEFYGGEPLLSFGLIRFLSREIRAIAESRDALFSFGLVTNGSLFRADIAKELVSLGLDHVKITLDGPAETHDKSRPFRSGAGTYTTIIRNIRETCDLTEINLGGNYTPENYEKFPLLLDDLEQRGLTPDKIHTVKFDPIIKQGDNVVSSSSPEFKGGCVSVNEPWISVADELLRKEILTRGFDTPKPAPIHCMVENADTYVVNFDGVIYKCPAFVGNPLFAAGDLETGMKDYSGAYKLGIWKNQECAECEYLPLCFGGCRYMAFIREGSITLDCKKAYLDASLERAVKQDIKYRK